MTDLGNMLDWKQPAFRWMLLAAVYALLTLACLLGRWESWYALNYIFGFASVAVVLSEKQPKVLSSFCAAFIGIMSAIASQYTVASGQIYSGGVASTESIAVVSTIAFVVLLISEFGLLDVGGRSSASKYLLIAAFFAWAFWAFDYFRVRLMYGGALPLETALNHGGIMLLCINEALTLIGVKYEYQENMSMVFMVLACIGAFLLTAVLGWGLGLLPLP